MNQEERRKAIDNLDYDYIIANEKDKIKRNKLIELILKKGIKKKEKMPEKIVSGLLKEIKELKKYWESQEVISERIKPILKEWEDEKYLKSALKEVFLSEEQRKLHYEYSI